MREWVTDIQKENNPGIVKNQCKCPEAWMCPESLRRLLCHGREERVVGKMRMITKMQNVYDPRCYKDFGFYVMDGKQLGVLNRSKWSRSVVSNSLQPL